MTMHEQYTGPSGRLIDAIFGEAKTPAEVAAIKAAREAAQREALIAAREAREAAQRAAMIDRKAAIAAAEAADKAARAAERMAVAVAATAVNDAARDLRGDGLAIPWGRVWAVKGAAFADGGLEPLLAVVAAVVAEGSAENADRVADLVADAFGLLEE